MAGIYRAIAYMAFSALLSWLWLTAVRRATRPMLPAPRRAVELRRSPVPSPPQARVDLEEFRWRYEDASFRWR
ncbi:MAG TPA: hypothetical protein EYP65_01685 [Armatimonadetes bacterium]|nr:hypothetical protein [Armatimonadota bacterium]